jgi:hypothetical protein
LFVFSRVNARRKDQHHGLVHTEQIKPIQSRPNSTRELVAQLERYCEYLESDRDYVIAQALSVAFRKDKGFGEWMKTHPLPKPVCD